MIDPSGIIQILRVTKKYDGVKALDDVSFSVKKGEFVALVGPSGAGKSTLVKLLIREELPTHGKLIVAGRDITRLRTRELPYYRRNVGTVFQDFKLLPQKTLSENVAFALEVCDASDDEIHDRVPRIIEMVGLTHCANKFPDELSGGEKQRVSIARAMVHHPKLLIADEPTGNLDPQNTREIVDLLLRINSAGTIVILATHDKEVVDSLHKRVVTLKDGKMISDQEKGRYIV